MRPGVLLLARSREPHAAALEREFARRRRPVLRLNPATYPSRRRLTLAIGPDAPVTLSVDDDTIMSPGVGWMGTQRVVRISGDVAPGAHRFAKSAALQGLDSFLRATAVPWINDYRAALRADDKFHQLQIAKELGFIIPDTVFTNDPGAFRAFLGTHRDIIAKSASGSAGLREDKRILTQRLRPRDARDAASVRWAPVLFQEYVPKASELRVTVVGNEVFPVRIHSQTSRRTRVDWRRYAPTMTYEVARLPRRVKDGCIAIARSLGLAYGGIDLVETPDGEHVFLEINSLPAWLWLEDATKLAITKAVADELERHIGRRPRGSAS
jgi:glutathione synthase/RimK-type ligase-like ATP-grasp enzyme